MFQENYDKKMSEYTKDLKRKIYELKSKNPIVYRAFQSMEFSDLCYVHVLEMIVIAMSENLEILEEQLKNKLEMELPTICIDGDTYKFIQTCDEKLKNK